MNLIFHILFLEQLWSIDGSASTCTPKVCTAPLMNNPNDVTKCCEKDGDKCKQTACESPKINNPDDVSKCCDEDPENTEKCKQVAKWDFFLFKLHSPCSFRSKKSESMPKIRLL